MKRSKKSMRNILAGLFMQFTGIVTGFVLRSVMLNTLGITAISLNGLFYEVLAMLSMAELGIGSAITYSLYKPLAEKNDLVISRYMNLFKDAYRLVCIGMLLIGSLFCPFIHYIIKDINLDLSYIQLIYMLFVVQSATTYLFSYKTALIVADQKRYIESLVCGIAKIISLIISIIILLNTHNYVLYLLSTIILNLCQNICFSIIADKLYPCLKSNAKLSKEDKKVTFSNIKNMFISKLSSKITNSTDNILISTLVGTISVGMYSNYALIINACKGIINQVEFSLTASIGNFVNTENTEKTINLLYRITYIIFLLSLLVCVCLYSVLSDLITVWLGAEYHISSFVVLVCMINFFLYAMRIPLWQSTTAMGLFKENTFISIVACVLNLIVSIVCGIKYGMVGIFLGTTLTFLVQISMKTYYLFTRRLNTSPLSYYIYFGGYCLLGIGTMIIGKLLCDHINIDNLWLEIITKICISFFLACLVGILPFIRSNSFKYFFNLISNISKVFKGV